LSLIWRSVWGPTLEIGARLSYDLVDRALAPYIGVHYERGFGETARLTRREGEDAGALFFGAGVRMMF
jgi:copper resistance protein B